MSEREVMGDLVGFRICPCDGDCRCATEEAATASAARFLRERFAGRRCDHKAVSCCERCNVMYLVAVAERAVGGKFRYVEPGA